MSTATTLNRPRTNPARTGATPRSGVQPQTGSRPEIGVQPHTSVRPQARVQPQTGDARVTDIATVRPSQPDVASPRRASSIGVAPLRPGTPGAPVNAAPSTSRPAGNGAVNGAATQQGNTSAREARGFVLYVGLDESKAELDNTTLTKLVEALKRVTDEVAPHAETYAAVALAPKGTGGRDVDVVRLALGEPQALAEYYGAAPEQEQPTGVTIDTTRRRVLLGGENVGLTYKEFELLQSLVLREGRTVDRAEIIDTLWRDAPDERPNDRTIDVHVRRLRSKLGPYADIVRTVRGTGYRFDRHADVDVLYSIAQSPDRF